MWTLGKILGVSKDSSANFRDSSLSSNYSNSKTSGFDFKQDFALDALRRPNFIAEEDYSFESEDLASGVDLEVGEVAGNVSESKHE